MSRVRDGLAWAVVLAGCLAMAPLTSAAPAGTVRVIHTIITNVVTTPVDVDGTGGPSVGDQLLFTNDLLSGRTHRKIGTGHAICTQLNEAGTLYDCQGSDRLPGGEIREAGTNDASSDGLSFRWAIIGGTGAFRDARGTVHGTFTDATFTRARYVLKVIVH